MTTKPRILLVDGTERAPWYREVKEAIDADWLIGGFEDLLEGATREVDLALVNDERATPSVSLAVCDLVRWQVPTLHLVDGIVEWRNTWENPLYSIGEEKAMPMFQPILCHKVACLGRAQARVFESWGNLGKCEVVGGVRFDRLLGRAPRQRVPGEPLRVLVMTAKCPGFTEEQRDLVRQSLRDVKAWFADYPDWNGIAVQPVWRLTGGLDQELGVANSLKDTFGTDLSDLLCAVDAMLSTPSTALLEGMLQGIPVASLDYTNSPAYNGAAWMITASQHVDRVLPQLLAPSQARMLTQDAFLHDSLECRSPATPRLERLILEMVKAGRDCRETGKPLTLPRRILADEQCGHHLPEARFDLGTLYSNHPCFGATDRTILQVELGHARRETARQQEQTARQQQEIARQQQEIARQQQEIARQQEQLKAILSSWTWRIASKFHRLVNRFRGRDMAPTAPVPKGGPLLGQTPVDQLQDSQPPRTVIGDTLQDHR